MFMLQKFKDIDSLMKDPNIPKSIRNIIVHNGVKFDDKAYNYDYIEIDSPYRIYAGYAERPNGWYWGSSEDEEFKKLFNGTEPVFDLHILTSGDIEYEKHRESLRLREVNAAFNPKYFNKNNGMKKNDIVIQQNLAEEIAKDCLENDYPIEYWEKEDFKGHDFEQARFKFLDRNHRRKIKQRLDKNPSTEKWPPLICLTDYYAPGKHAFVSGKHRYDTWSKHPRTTIIPVKLIPREVWIVLTTDGVELLGNIFNDPTSDPKKDSDPDDFINVVYRGYKSLCSDKHIKSWWDIQNWTPFLERRGMDESDRRYIKKQVKKLIENDSLPGGMEFYEPTNSEIEDRLTELRQEFPNSTVHSFSTDVPVLERLMKKDLDKNNRHLVYLGVHNSYESYLDWNNKKIELQKLVDYYNRPLIELKKEDDELDISDKIITVQFEEMQQLRGKKSQQL